MSKGRSPRGIPIRCLKDEIVGSHEYLGLLLDSKQVTEHWPALHLASLINIITKHLEMLYHTVFNDAVWGSSTRAKYIKCLKKFKQAGSVVMCSRMLWGQWWSRKIQTKGYNGQHTSPSAHCLHATEECVQWKALIFQSICLYILLYLENKMCRYLNLAWNNNILALPTPGNSSEYDHHLSSPTARPCIPTGPLAK